MSNGSAYSTIPEVRDLNLPGMTRNYEDTTSLDSTQFTEKKAVLADPGTGTFTINYKSHALHQQLADDFLAGTERKYYMYVPVATPEYWTFTASVASFPLAMPQNSIKRASVTLQIVGAVTRVTSEPAA